MISINMPEGEFMRSGHVGCAGCGATIAMRFALKALGKDTIVIIPACCWGVISGAHPQSALEVPVLHTAFATGGATASGVRAALDMKGDTKTTVMTWAGDGGTFDIGIQSLSGAVERNEDIIWVCYDNEAYMNTGVQRSSSTPYGTRTTTTPDQGWKQTRKKNIVETLAAHRIPYAATASIAFPEDLIRKFKKAKDMKGNSRFLHVFASCPTGWGLPTELSIKAARLAVQTNIFPLYEVEDGINYTLNSEGSKSVTEYLEIQGRFKHLSESDVNQIQEMVNDDWKLLKKKVNGASPDSS